MNKPTKEQLTETARNLAMTHNLLQNGIFQGHAYKDLAIAIPFVEELHKQVMADLEPMLDNPEEPQQVESAQAGDTNE